LSSLTYVRVVASAATVLAVALVLPAAGCAGESEGPRAQTQVETPAARRGRVRYVSPAGDDESAGTKQRPWRTIGKAMRSLRPGETAFVRAGEYVERTAGPCRSSYNALDWTASGTSKAPITIAGYPGEEERVVVRTTINIRGSHVRLRNLVLERNTAYSSFDRRCTGSVNLAVYGSDVSLLDLQVRHAAMSGVFVDGANRVTIGRSVIRTNGTHPNLDHGIYVSAATSLLVANNVISGNLGYGVQFYRDRVRGARIVHNTVVANGRSGLVMSGDVSGSRIANNIFAYNAEYGMREFELEGGDNVGIRNLFYGNAKRDTWFPDNRLATVQEIVADPLFRDPESGNVRLREGSAAVDRAASGYGVAIDLERRKRPSGRADIGAFER
jgi:hypothetical protein